MISQFEVMHLAKQKNPNIIFFTLRETNSLPMKKKYIAGFLGGENPTYCRILSHKKNNSKIAGLELKVALNLVQVGSKKNPYKVGPGSSYTVGL